MKTLVYMYLYVWSDCFVSVRELLVVEVFRWSVMFFWFVFFSMEKFAKWLGCIDRRASVFNAGVLI